ncbi:thiamine-binding protein [Halorussus sp. MSC15.2]|uniref:thiamine-binding protein n=1 Tax=Halorussus sp. MSC15.2 TaxID=2283638 RepID=UPI0013D76D64|nr:thiamine-binding protein [Halorussus sp. MSC15.2]NEU57785.1 thiamine-binding protein [Halorussus sp. MSC15.2]
MTAIARLEIIPVREGSMAPSIARAVEMLDQFDVSYETTATDTIIEAESIDQVFDAVRAAHKAIPDERVVTSIEIDDVRGRRQRVGDRVASVERALGRPPRRIRESPQQQAPSQQSATAGGTQGSQQSQQRYSSRSGRRTSERRPTPTTSSSTY